MDSPQPPAGESHRFRFRYQPVRLTAPGRLDRVGTPALGSTTTTAPQLVWVFRYQPARLAAPGRLGRVGTPALCSMSNPPGKS